MGIPRTLQEMAERSGLGRLSHDKGETHPVALAMMMIEKFDPLGEYDTGDWHRIAAGLVRQFRETAGRGSAGYFTHFRSREE